MATHPIDELRDIIEACTAKLPSVGYVFVLTPDGLDIGATTGGLANRMHVTWEELKTCPALVSLRAGAVAGELSRIAELRAKWRAETWPAA